METPTPQIELSCVVAVAVFLERRPEAERMEHTAWNCFLNRFFFQRVFFIYFNLSQDALAKSSKNAVLLNLNQGSGSAEGPTGVSSGDWGKAKEGQQHITGPSGAR